MALNAKTNAAIARGENFTALEQIPQWYFNTEAYSRDGLINDDLLGQLVLGSQLYNVYKVKPIFNITKRIFDFTLAATLLIVLIPLFLLIGLVIKLTSEGPIFYKQERVGRFFIPFTIYKFRTMHAKAERYVYMHQNEMKGGLFKLKKDPRMTRVGRILRKLSMDELPQLYNVLRGDMSFIGPRPLVPEDTATVAREDYLRFAAVPGMSGLWQVKIRGSRDGREKIKMDCEYVRNRCWKFDIMIILKTIPAVITGKGAF